MPQKAYAAAGVDVYLGNRVKRGIHNLAASTHGPEVLGKIGGFGGLFRPDFKGMRDPVLVSSVDGVGTKLKIAFATGRHDTVGQDLVNHCINDIAVIVKLGGSDDGERQCPLDKIVLRLHRE